MIAKNNWDDFFQVEQEKEYFKKMMEFLSFEYKTKVVYPKFDDIFNALKLTDYNDVKVLLLGQDPYHGANQAHGLSFSVKPTVKIPPSLKNIFKELNSDLSIKIPNNGYLKKWATQGVLLLNSTLTVIEGCPNSHSKIGWQTFTDNIIIELNKRLDPVIFILWGNFSKTKTNLITNKNHYILTAPHPSPLSAYNGFFGCAHFSKTNEILKSLNKNQIDWEIENYE